MDIERMHSMIEKLSETALGEFEKGIECVDTCEMGQVTDMLKDLAEAMYYRTLTKAMDESEDDEIMEIFDRYGDDRRFYDHYRYSDGRFAPKGRGSRMGYQPYLYMQDDDWMKEYFGRKKYDGEKSRYGESYDRYDESKRHYHDTKDADSKRRMDDSMKTYTDDVIHSIKEMWSDADSTLRQTMKADLTKMIQQLQ